ncbi:MAG TPA: tetratricopeptide repeat protein [Chthonomonas sp.]|uniref:tetratricopeptide repeat protein n=1 Tax=Chthonomonas sp. TaxID=2282153 RepID=UPI002B4B0C71|nr:tetratricopeptide repeat protein [Chthonomonas sp.]HLI47891.1 tetratricopeptide repeat protein [Chthonomonas sp.]
MARLLTYHPHSIEDWIGYARCAANCNHLHKAFDAYQRVLSFDPHNADALIAIGQIEARAGLYTDGLHHIQQGLAINPKASVDTISYISCLIARAQWLEAWQWITPILKVNPTYDDLYPYVYRIARHLGKLQEAAEYFHTRIQIGNEEPPSRIHAYLALIKVSQAKTPQDYLAAAKEAQQEVWAPMRYYAGAVILFQCHDLTHALKLVNKGLSLHPGDIALLQLKETIYQTQHKQTLAHQISDEIAYQEGFTPQILILQKRVAQNPQDIGLELQLARALQQHGNYAAAAEVYQQVLQRHPHDEEALQQLLLCRQNALDSLDIAVKQGKL